MFARINYVRFKTDHLDEVVARWPQAVAMYRGHGFERGIFLLDRTSGNSVSVVVFASERELRANESGGTFQDAVKPFAAWRLSEPDKHYYELAATVVPWAFSPIAYVRLADVTLKLATLDKVIAGWPRDVSSYRGEDGFRGAYLCVDRATGKAASLTLWRARADIEANERSGAFMATVEPYKDMIAIPPTRSYWEVAAVVERG
ncbi:MAG: hypothetical protein ACREGL_10625 [Alphaproteobacteria bacterium]